METILVQPKNVEELKIVKEFLTQSKIKFKALSQEEDCALSLQMKEEKTGKNISEETILKKLRLIAK